METLTIVLPNEPATRQLGAALGQILPSGSTILLKGDLGSGKTTLVQGLGQALGIVEPLMSPTFVLINEYAEGRVPLYHLDLYRLQPAEVMPLNLESYWEGTEFTPGIVAIEWSERLPYLPESYLEIQLEPIEPDGRQALLTTIGQFPASVLQALQQLVSNQNTPSGA